MSDFQKDAFSIACGAFLGAMCAHAWGYGWFFGIILGGITGYGIRMCTEPARMRVCAQWAYEKVSDRLLIDWRERVRSDFYVGIGLGGIFSVTIGFCLIIAGLVEGKSISFLVFWYLLVHVIMNIFILFFTFFVSFLFYTQRDPVRVYDDEKMLCRHLNSIIIHYHIVRFSLIYTWKGILHAPLLWQFAKTFFRLVHSDNFTACGVYASLVATIIFFTTPYQPLWLLLGAVVGGIAGAGARRIIVARLMELPIRV